MINNETKNAESYRFILLISGLLLSLFVLIYASFMFGIDNYSLKEVYNAIFNYQDTNQQNILREIRIPRVLAAVLVGMALSVSGAVMQGVTKNPLADPSLIGLNAGAMLAISILFGINSNANFIVVMLVGFVGAMIGGAMVLSIGMSRRGGFNTIRIILAGAAVSALLTALSQGISLFFKTNQTSNLWTSGGVKGMRWEHLYVASPIIVVILMLILILSHRLTVMSLGEELAQGLGVNTSFMRTVFSILTMCLAGIAVAMAGNLAFVGLVVPHIARFLIGTDYKKLIPLTMVLGAGFIVLADTIARMMGEATLNVVVAIIGVPFFIYLVRRDGKS